jgi:hypothetical protein
MLRPRDWSSTIATLAMHLNETFATREISQDAAMSSNRVCFRRVFVEPFENSFLAALFGHRGKADDISEHHGNVPPSAGWQPGTSIAVDRPSNSGTSS